MARRKPVRKLYSPAVWPAWFVVGLGWLIARLPMDSLWRLGRGLGTLLYWVGGSRKRVTETNLAICFPELSTEEIRTLTIKNFHQVAIGGLELLVPWLNPRRDLSAAFRVEGAEHLQAALAQDRGVILVGAHFAVMDVIAQPLSSLGPVDLMYRYNKNPVWEWLQVNGRRHFFDWVIERENTRQVLKNLRNGHAIWYAADQDYGIKHSVFAPFFGVNAATIIATARFARLNDSPVLFLRQTRHLDHTDGVRWSLHFSAPFENYPTGDDEEDARRMNAFIEKEIRLHPDQYLWLHKRFKTRPAGEMPLYDD